MKISGSVVLITGANRGVGRVYARELVARGTAKVYGAARDPAAVTEPGVIPIALDITDPGRVAHVAAQCTDVSLLVNNAGVLKYQLTPVGSPAPGLHVAAKITGGQFIIAGGPAGTEVCWQVTGIRKDRWASAHRIPVEQDKPAADQGRYLHPDLYDGQPLTELARSPLTARNRPA